MSSPKDHKVSRETQSAFPSAEELDMDERLHSWYEDSLELLSQAVTEPPRRKAKRKAIPAIYCLTRDGEVLWSRGNVTPCRSYVKKIGLLELLRPGSRIETDSKGVLMAWGYEDYALLVHCPPSYLAQIFHGRNDGRDLPPAETRLLAQLLQGLDLRQAAQEDGVSYETKRSQFKSLNTRTKLSGQGTVIRDALLAIAGNVLDLAGAPAGSSERSATKFLADHYPGLFRFYVISEGKSSVAVAETGPLDGKPVIWLHSQTLPSPNQFEGSWAQDKKIRFLMPLREGFLSHSRQPYDVRRHVNYCTHAIARVITVACQGKAHVIANSTASPYAVKLAVEYPELLAGLTFVAAAYVGEYDNPSVRQVTRSISHMAAWNTWLLDAMFDRYLEEMRKPEGLSAIFALAYGAQSLDFQILSDLLARDRGHAWFYESYKLSRHSVIMDIAMSGRKVWRDAEKAGCHVQFIHGALDPINKIDAAQRVAQRFPSVNFKALPDKGQGLFLTDLPDLVSWSLAPN